MTNDPFAPIANTYELPKEFRDDVTAFYTEAVAQNAWTNRKLVVLGAYAPDGKYHVPVPSAYRHYQNECYYTEVDGSGVGRCINDVTGFNSGKYVWVGWPPGVSGGILHVERAATTPEINQVTNQGGVPPHSEQHGARNINHNGAQTTGHVGNDLVLIDPRQMWENGIFPLSGFQARINGGWLNYGGKRQYWDGVIITDQTSNVPAGSGDAAWVLIERDADGTMTYTKGTEFKWQTANNQTGYVPTGSDNTEQWAVLVRNGDTEFTPACLWNLSQTQQVQGLPITVISASSNTSGPGIYEIDSSGGVITLTVDSDDIAAAGRVIVVKDTGDNAGTNGIVIATEGAETIDGDPSLSISVDGGSVQLYADGSNLYTFGGSGGAGGGSAGGGWTVDHNTVIPSGMDAFIPGIVTVSGGTLTVNGDLYIV